MSTQTFIIHMFFFSFIVIQFVDLTDQNRPVKDIVVHRQRNLKVYC